MWTCAVLRNSHVPGGEAGKYNHKFPISSCNCHVLRKRFSAERGADGEMGTADVQREAEGCRMQRCTSAKAQWSKSAEAQ